MRTITASRLDRMRPPRRDHIAAPTWPPTSSHLTWWDGCIPFCVWEPRGQKSITLNADGQVERIGWHPSGWALSELIFRTQSMETCPDV